MPLMWCALRLGIAIGDLARLPAVRIFTHCLPLAGVRQLTKMTVGMRTVGGIRGPGLTGIVIDSKRGAETVEGDLTQEELEQVG